ncbi:MAG TPA: dicarboxylate/amino acid:cation symporter [Gammaproteobacteria bacterium]|nr:dicarboxylate/amino acid:cation symporter [Gammaproteobacteria bacterium]
MTRQYNTVLYLIAIVLGIVSGISELPSLLAFASFISEVFIRIFQCISLPIIALSIIVTLSSYQAETAMKKVWKRTIFFTFSTTFIAATVSALLYLLIQPSKVTTLIQPLAAKPEALSYLQHLSQLIPTNIFSPFLEHQVMGVLLVGILIGIATRYIPEKEARQTLTDFFKGIQGIFMVITAWVVALIPLGLFGFISVTVTQFQHGMQLKGIGEYLAIVVLANLFQGLVILPFWLKLNGSKPFELMRKALPALSLAFFSKSSAGTLPVTINTAEQKLGLNPKICRLVLPLCTSLNMNGCAAFIFTTVIFLMQNNGMTLHLTTLALWIVIATITAIGNAGVPMGCFFLSASLLVSMNVPINLLGLILPFYSLIDMLETALNVWSDLCVTKVVDERALLDEELAKKLSLQGLEF